MREAILRTAADLFARCGDDVGLDEIAAATGISAGQLRDYFTSTVGVRRAVDAHQWERLLRAAAA